MRGSACSPPARGSSIHVARDDNRQGNDSDRYCRNHEAEYALFHPTLLRGHCDPPVRPRFSFPIIGICIKMYRSSCKPPDTGKPAGALGTSSSADASASEAWVR